ncbi:cysteine hydrolase family protein [Lysinibacillus sphaericus]|uniref:Acetyltransferase n=1 Tax=Lysinibacillus sphaericus OT4b.31 TaxID=1285586 RepID=R7Z949_LYSSH|nr:cysteine hydrolase family protein [Lysinibacillus sphaericus]EON70554.1 acetyltransferase [Lysinibacillus sphaericus OT4b.31]
MKQALVIVDMQEVFFINKKYQLFEGDKVVVNINHLIKWARAKEIQVIFIQHTDLEQDDEMACGKPGWELHHGLHKQQEDKVIEKTTWDAFYGTELAQYLQDSKVDQLIFVGAQTEFCLDTTIRSAYSHGYHHNILIEGAHSTINSHLLDAEQIVEHHELIWNNRFVTIQPSTNYQLEEA